MSSIVLVEQSSAPTTPATGKVAVFVDTNGDLSWKDDAGYITKIAAAGSYTLTIPASGTAALRDVANTFSAQQTFSQSPIAPGMKPASDSTTAIQLTNAAGTAIANVDTTNSRVGIGTTSPSGKLEVLGAAEYNSIVLDPNTDSYGVYLKTTKGASATESNLYLDPASGSVSLVDGTDAFDLNIYDATTQSVSLKANGSSWLNGGNVGIGTASPDTRLDIDAGAMEFAEMTAPSGGVANTARLFARDNGSGKTQLCVIFATGAIQVLATEP